MRRTITGILVLCIGGGLMLAPGAAPGVQVVGALVALLGASSAILES